jgi:hypothetical protein
MSPRQYYRHEQGKEMTSSQRERYQGVVLNQQLRMYPGGTDDVILERVRGIVPTRQATQVEKILEKANRRRRPRGMLVEKDLGGNWFLLLSINRQLKGASDVMNGQLYLVFTPPNGLSEGQLWEFLGQLTFVHDLPWPDDEAAENFVTTPQIRKRFLRKNKK